MHVLIIYDSLPAGKRAKELCDRLGKHLASGRPPTLSVWSLSTLQFPALAQAAASEAGNAALLIVALSGDTPLPQWAKSCLAKCACAIRTADGALVAQLRGILPINEELCPVYGCLRDIAHHAGVRFFSEVVEGLDNQSDSSLEEIYECARPNTSAAAHSSED